MSSDIQLIRLQKFIADCGVTSRRKAEGLILQGKVYVNDELVTELGTKVNPNKDLVIVDGQAISKGDVEKLYVLLHKPRGVMTTLFDPEGRETVIDLIPEITERVYPVGRLDYLSEGLLILTNDGELSNRIMHPKYEVTKVYEVKVFGLVTAPMLKRLRDGVQAEDGFLKAKSVRVIKQLPNKTWLEFRLGEGRNREVRRLCEACGLTVDKLKRVSIGGLTVEGIAPGNYRYTTLKEIERALAPVGPNNSSIEVWSTKKTIDLKGKRMPNLQKGKLADDQVFHKFRREFYFDSIKAYKEAKKQDQIKQEQEELKQRQEAQAEREKKREEREQRKLAKLQGKHVQIVK